MPEEVHVYVLGRDIDDNKSVIRAIEPSNYRTIEIHMITEDEIIEIGTIRRPHGKQGEVQCQMLNDYWEEAEDAEWLVLRIDNIPVPMRVDEWRGKGSDTLIMKLHTVTSEDAAARLSGTTAYMLKRDLEGIDTDAITWQELRGYRVMDSEQGDLGEVTDVDESTINTLLTLDTGSMIPIHEDFILDIDTAQRVLHINLPFILS